MKRHTEALRQALAQAWCSFHRTYHPVEQFAAYRGVRQRYCRAGRADYMRQRRADLDEAASLRNRYETDEAYREHRKALSRASMRAFRSR